MIIPIIIIIIGLPYWFGGSMKTEKSWGKLYPQGL